jgi:hypothetical protein
MCIDSPIYTMEKPWNGYGLLKKLAITGCTTKKRPTKMVGRCNFFKSPYRLLHGMRLLHIVAEHHHVIKHIYQYRVVLINGTSQYLFTQSVYNFLLNQTF